MSLISTHNVGGKKFKSHKNPTKIYDFNEQNLLPEMASPSPNTIKNISKYTTLNNQEITINHPIHGTRAVCMAHYCC
jgi:hypothetical protein